MPGWDDVTGAVLDDRYEVGARLGRGGSAAVHHAWDRVRGREVAVKLLARADDRPGRSESAILSALDHPRLVALHDVLDTAEGTALVMELVDGPSLRERLTSGPLPIGEALLVLRDVAAGLAHAHRRGVVHRDVTPGNVLLRVDAGRVVSAKLADFGIARRADATRTTGERTVVGTVRYLSPEQVRGERATDVSDVYSLGLTVLAALTGEDAFPGQETESLAGRLVRAPAIPASLPADWAALLGGMTAVAPESRFDASAVAALACALGSAAPATVGTAPDEGRTRPVDLARLRSVVHPRPRRARMLAAVAGTTVAGAVLGGLVAAVLAPTAVQQALTGTTPAPAAPAAVAPDPVGPDPVGPAPAPAPVARPTPSAPAVPATPATGSVPADDHVVAARTSGHDDRSGRGSSGPGSGGHGSGRGSGDSGKGSGRSGKDD